MYIYILPNPNPSTYILTCVKLEDAQPAHIIMNVSA